MGTIEGWSYILQRNLQRPVVLVSFGLGFVSPPVRIKEKGINGEGDA